jgi:transcriptional regulator with XRE-family HTH domain
MNKTYQGDFKKIGRRIRCLREGKGFSQELLSFKADIHRTYLSQLELGQRNPSYTTLLKLSDALSINITELIRIDETT